MRLLFLLGFFVVEVVVVVRQLVAFVDVLLSTDSAESTLCVPSFVTFQPVNGISERLLSFDSIFLEDILYIVPTLQ